MVTIVFFILMLMIFGKLLIFGIKAAWGISKFLLTVVLLPVILIGLALKKSGHPRRISSLWSRSS